jgi:hypothetical protein
MPDLPITALSVSGVRTLRQCPERWRRRYIEKDYEPPTGKMTLGKLVGAAETQSDHVWIDSGEPLGTDQVLDAYRDEWRSTDAGEVNWQGDAPSTLEDSGRSALRAYHRDVVSTMAAPVDAEREARLEVEHPDGSLVEFVAYVDVETEDGLVIDRKVTTKKWSQDQADADSQVDGYLAARRAEDNPASGFEFHPMVRTKAPYAQEPLETDRSDEQLDHFLLDLLGAADEIAWRMETDNWSFAPDGAWWCGEKSCGYWSSCPAGGLLRRRAAQAVMAA